MTAAPPPGYDPAAYPPVAVTVDLVVFTIVADALHILLIRRGEEPYLGRWALPGGFVKPDEDLDAAALRELAEETGFVRDDIHLEQLGAYGAPGRDPRMRIVTVAHWAICANLPIPEAGGDAAAADLVAVSEIERGSIALAFDHEAIVRDAVERIRARLDQPELAAKFCPPAFTISQLRQVYEAVWRKKIDPGNFQRRVRRSGVFDRLVRATTPSGQRGGRPASVWNLAAHRAAAAPDWALADTAAPTMEGAAPPPAAPPGEFPRLRARGMPVSTREHAHRPKRRESLADLAGELRELLGPPVRRRKALGDLGDRIGARIFDVELHESKGDHPGDGVFRSGPLAGRTVDIRLYSKRTGLLDLREAAEKADYELVLSGPRSSKPPEGEPPWGIHEVFLFELEPLVAAIKARDNRVGVATAVRMEEWDAARIWPEPAPDALLRLTRAQQTALRRLRFCD